jgi:hypothetical protein
LKPASNPKKAEISCNRPQGELAWPLDCKATLNIIFGVHVYKYVVTLKFTFKILK